MTEHSGTDDSGTDDSDTDEEGDDVGESRNPDLIQAEIEATRAELASTIDAIAERVSPKRVAGRGAAAVKAQVSGAFSHNGHPASPGPAESAQASGPPATEPAARALRVDRVVIVAGVAVALIGLLAIRRRRR